MTWSTMEVKEDSEILSHSLKIFTILLSHYNSTTTEILKWAFNCNLRSNYKSKVMKFHMIFLHST